VQPAVRVDQDRKRQVWRENRKLVEINRQRSDEHDGPSPKVKDRTAGLEQAKEMLSAAVGWRAEKGENHPVTGELVRTDDLTAGRSQLKARNLLARHDLMERLKRKIE